MNKFAKALTFVVAAATSVSAYADAAQATEDDLMLEGDNFAHVQLDSVLDAMQRDEGLPTFARDQLSAGVNWTNNEIRYCFDPKIDARAKAGIKGAVAHYNEKFGTCLKFMEVATVASNYGNVKGTMCAGYPAAPSIFIQSSDGGCYANMLGEMGAGLRSRYVQVINIGRGCEGLGVCVHEIGHAIGMAHEQTRPDRDGSIAMQWDNITEDWKGQFKMNPKGFTTRPYCYESVMHYGAFSAVKDRSKPGMKPINCNNSWECKNASKCTCPSRLGQRRGLADCDTEQLKLTYKCGGTTTPPPTGSKDKFGNCGSFKNYCGQVAQMPSWCPKTCA